MINFHERVLQYPQYHRQFECNNSMITAFNCPADARLMQTRFSKLWTEYNYLFYVVEGKKIWHTSDGIYEVSAGSCIFIRKGAFVLEQFWDIGFCLVLFFIPDEFICHTLGSRLALASQTRIQHRQVISLQTNDTLKAYFESMSAYFAQHQEPDPALIELKFRELILTIADNPRNKEVLAYFCSLIHEPRPVGLQRVMLDNFRFNLRLEQFAKLSNRSLSAFKRDFQEMFRTTPGKWLLEKRLELAFNLIPGGEKTIIEIANECGFETAAHFSRAFKSKFGMQPSAMRKSVDA